MILFLLVLLAFVTGALLYFFTLYAIIYFTISLVLVAATFVANNNDRVTFSKFTQDNEGVIALVAMLYMMPVVFVFMDDFSNDQS